MVTVKQILNENPQLMDLLLEGNFGIELEQHRILTDGQLSRYPYPQVFRSRRHNPYLKTDFSDTMTEIASAPTLGATAAVKNTKILQQIVHDQLHEDERYWPLSVLPELNDADLEYAGHNNTRHWMDDYHDYLQEKYGTVRQIMTGVHVGYSLNDSLIYGLYHHGFKEKYASMTEFRNEIYFQLAQGFVLNRWLFTYLFGCSPLLTNRPTDLPAEIQGPMRSFRSSKYGYANLPDEEVAYGNFDQFINQIQQYVDDGTYFSHHEFYGPVRLKTPADTLVDIKNNGTRWIEIRAYDLDPLSRSGISNDTLNFLELYLTYILTLEEPAELNARLVEAVELNNQVALQNPTEQFDWVKDRASELLDQLEAFADEVNAPKIYQDALLFTRRRVEDPSLTISGQIMEKLTSPEDYLNYGLLIANDRFSMNRHYEHPLEVLKDQYPENTQQLLRAAIEMGVTVIFEDDSHFELSVGDHLEFFDKTIKFIFPEGPEQYLANMFPELAEQTDEKP